MSGEISCKPACWNIRFSRVNTVSILIDKFIFTEHFDSLPVKSKNSFIGTG